MAENLTGMIHNDLHKYLTGMHEVDDKLPQCQDVEEKWESIAQSYLPDGIREFTAYPTTSLGWMMYIGMAMVKFWDEEWEIFGNIEDLYSYMRDKRGYDCMDEYIREEVLRLKGDDYDALEKLITLILLSSRNMSRIIREARPLDMAEIMKVMDAAKKIMRQSGNMHQWGEGYPSEAVITADMEKNGGFVVEDDGMIVSYFAFLPSPEPTYSKIYEGEWLDNERPYHVVHRIASYPDVHGIFSSIMDFCFSHDPNIRIDTHRDNKIMQHNIMKHGFSYCGIIYLASGDALDQSYHRDARTVSVSEDIQSFLLRQSSPTSPGGYSF